MNTMIELGSIVEETKASGIPGPKDVLNVSTEN